MARTNQVLNGAQVIIDYLIREKVPYAFGLCGYSYASIRGLQRGYLGGPELATDFRHPETGEPYNPDFAALARSCGIDGVGIDRAAISATRLGPLSRAASHI
jgi:thiamine pyrophosphate-dependent acetolactate synthase large subunit-like protein